MNKHNAIASLVFFIVNTFLMFIIHNYILHNDRSNIYIIIESILSAILFYIILTIYKKKNRTQK